MHRKVKYLLPATDIDMGGIIVKQALPTQQVRQVDPYLLLHHGKFNFTDAAPAMKQGIGPHPHRGFTPVTFVVDGEVHHRDSRGNSQIAKKGEVQWMHAGAGIVHSERPSEALAKASGTQEVIQLWINTPAAKKMQVPTYQHISEEDIPKITSADGAFTTKIVAGKYNELSGRIKTESELLVLWSYSSKAGTVSLELPSHMNAMLYLIKGAARLKDYGLVEAETLAVFDSGGDHVTISTEGSAELLLLAGTPLDEELVQQGPFVMNSTTEIMEAMRDYQMGKMGILIEE